MNSKLKAIYGKQRELLMAYRMARARREELWHQQVPQAVRDTAIDEELHAYEAWYMSSRVAIKFVSGI